jgi:prepilin-type N-terminal cleavage/methylation domain-containing protein
MNLGGSIISPSAHRQRQRKSSRRGFTILEVMMATFVMGLGIATSIVAMQSGFRHLDLARGTTIASQIIQSEMEQIRMMSWTKLSALPATWSFDGGDFFSNNPKIRGKYTVTRTRTPDPARPLDIMNLSISVRWQTYDGRWHTRSFSALYARNGLYDYLYTIAHS